MSRPFIPLLPTASTIDVSFLLFIENWYPNQHQVKSTVHLSSLTAASESPFPKIIAALAIHAVLTSATVGNLDPDLLTILDLAAHL